MIFRSRTEMLLFDGCHSFDELILLEFDFLEFSHLSIFFDHDENIDTNDCDDAS